MIDAERIVEVEYEYPDVGPAFSVGWMRESPEHLILIQQRIVGYDQCCYVVIPKRFIKKITELI